MALNLQILKLKDQQKKNFKKLLTINQREDQGSEQLLKYKNIQGFPKVWKQRKINAASLVQKHLRGQLVYKQFNLILKKKRFNYNMMFFQQMRYHVYENCQRVIRKYWLIYIENKKKKEELQRLINQSHLASRKNSKGKGKKGSSKEHNSPYSQKYLKDKEGQSKYKGIKASLGMNVKTNNIINNNNKDIQNALNSPTIAKRKQSSNKVSFAINVKANQIMDSQSAVDINRSRFNQDPTKNEHPAARFSFFPQQNLQHDQDNGPVNSSSQEIQNIFGVSTTIRRTSTQVSKNRKSGRDSKQQSQKDPSQNSQLSLYQMQLKKVIEDQNEEEDKDEHHRQSIQEGHLNLEEESSKLTDSSFGEQNLDDEILAFDSKLELLKPLHKKSHSEFQSFGLKASTQSVQKQSQESKSPKHRRESKSKKSQNSRDNSSQNRDQNNSKLEEIGQVSHKRKQSVIYRDKSDHRNQQSQGKIFSQPLDSITFQKRKSMNQGSTLKAWH
eukprot:403359867